MGNVCLQRTCTTKKLGSRSLGANRCQLQRRNDLVPNLVETVKGYAKHEQETLTQVIAMRNQIANMGSDVSPQEKMEASNQLSGALKLFSL